MTVDIDTAASPATAGCPAQRVGLLRRFARLRRSRRKRRLCPRPPPAAFRSSLQEEDEKGGRI